MRFIVQEASSEEEVRRCRALAAEVHGLPLDSELDGGWPDRWLMGLAGDRLVATIGLSGRAACVRWFQGPAAFPLAAALRESGATDVAELRLISVLPAVRGYRFARLLFAAACSGAFLAPDGGVVAVLVHARPLVFRVLERCYGTAMRPVWDGPTREGRRLCLMVPGRDVPEQLLRTPLPSELTDQAFRRPPFRGRGRARS